MQKMVVGKKILSIKAVLESPAFFWFIVALVVRLLVGVAAHIYSLRSGYGGFYPLPSGHDDAFYWKQALELYGGGVLPKANNIYPYLLAWLFRLTGPSLVAGKLLNIVASALGVGVGVSVCGRLLGIKEGGRFVLLHPVNVAGLVLTFYPSYVFYSTQLIKDSLLVLAGLWLVYLVTDLIEKPAIKSWLFFGAGLAFHYGLRPYAAIALQAAILVSLVFVYRRNFWRSYRVVAPFLLIFAITPYLLGLDWFAVDYIRPLLNIRQVVEFRETVYSTGGGAANISLDRSNPVLFVLTYGYSFITAFFGPLPWQIKSLVQLVALPEALFMWLLSPLFVLGIWSLAKGREKENFLLVFSLFLVGAVALFSDNIGANTRLRLLPWSVFFIYAAVLWGRRSGKYGGDRWITFPLQGRRKRMGERQ